MATVGRLACIAMGIWLVATGLALPDLVRTQPWVGLAVIAAAALCFVAEPARWGCFAAGVWLIAAPFALDYHRALAALDSYTSGMVLAVLSLYATPKAFAPLPAEKPAWMDSFQGRGRAGR